MQEPEEIVSAFTEVTTESESNLAIMPEYAAVYEQNCDLYGWLRIDDTPINYPVMYTPDDSQYYLRRAFDKKDAKSGTPFIDAACFEGCGNYIIYGHNMKNGMNRYFLKDCLIRVMITAIDKPVPSVL